jgi:hypothetical protein
MQRETTTEVHHTVDAACGDHRVQTSEGTPEGGSHAVDDFCHSLGLVALRIGNILHVGWIHPYPLGRCDRGHPHQDYSGAPTPVAPE